MRLTKEYNFLWFIVSFILGGIISFIFFLYLFPAHSSISRPKHTDKYISFVNESYHIIEDNYWKKMSDEELARMFFDAAELLTGQIQNIKTYDRRHFESKLEEWIRSLPPEKKKEIVVKLVKLVLTNLAPRGRSKLYMKKDEIALRNEVENKAEENLYKVLDVNKNVDSQTLKEVYSKKKSELEKLGSPEAKQEIKKIKEAYQTLSDLQTRKRYEKSGIATTVEGELITPEILHLSITRFSPTTLDDLKRVSEKFDKGDKLDTLILDLRNNIGGAIDGLPYFLGPFIGPDQYAYEFLHQGKKEGYRTRIGWLNSLTRYKKVVILVNRNTQSSAEVFAAVLKRFNVGVVVGEKTRGWGTIERVFPIKHQLDSHEKYSIFLVHRITLRDDNQPIESNGVEPVIKMTDSHWKDELYHYFPDSSLISAVEKVWNE